MLWHLLLFWFSYPSCPLNFCILKSTAWHFPSWVGSTRVVLQFSPHNLIAQTTHQSSQSSVYFNIYCQLLWKRTQPKWKIYSQYIKYKTLLFSITSRFPSVERSVQWTALWVLSWPNLARTEEGWSFRATSFSTISKITITSLW